MRALAYSLFQISAAMLGPPRYKMFSRGTPAGGDGRDASGGALNLKLDRLSNLKLNLDPNESMHHGGSAKACQGGGDFSGRARQCK